LKEVVAITSQILGSFGLEADPDLAAAVALQVLWLPEHCGAVAYQCGDEDAALVSCSAIGSIIL
jgi:hypothetical protein